MISLSRRIFAVDINHGSIGADEWAFDLLVGAQWASSQPGLDACSFARVRFDVSGADWDWVTLNKEASGVYGGCRVDAQNFVGLVASPWSDEAYVWGSYLLTRPVPYSEYGGVCAVDLNAYSNVSTIMTPVGTDNKYEYGVADVVPNPHVAELLLVVPQVSTGSIGECSKSVIDGNADICPTTGWPVFAERDAAGWRLVSRQESSIPLVGVAAAWDEASDDALYYATGGSGVWKGTLTW